MRGYAIAETGGGGADGGIEVELRKGNELLRSSADSGKPTRCRSAWCVSFTG